MNTEKEIAQAIEDYQAARLGEMRDEWCRPRSNKASAEPAERESEHERISDNRRRSRAAPRLRGSPVVDARPRDLGGFTVGRALPAEARRHVGPFVFFDQMGPADFAPGHGLDVRPAASSIRTHGSRTAAHWFAHARSPALGRAPAGA